MLGFAEDLPFQDFHPNQLRILVKANASDDEPAEITFTSAITLLELLEKAGKLLQLPETKPGTRVFLQSGEEVLEPDQIEDNEVLTISQGEDFKASKNSSGQNIGGYILKDLLGQGGFGSVYRAVKPVGAGDAMEVAAVKFVEKRGLTNFEDLQQTFQEIQTLRSLKHPNVIRILDCVDHPTSVCFVMEFAGGGELKDFVAERDFLDEDTARPLFHQVVKGLSYCHNLSVIHRDLKLENLLLDEDGVVKIADFGLAGVVSHHEATETDAGTQAYLAPEVWRGQSGQHDPYKLDIWALGVILYAMLHGRLPFSAPTSEVCSMLETQGIPRLRENLTTSAVALLRKQLTPNSQHRASIGEVANDPWVVRGRFVSAADGDLEDGSQSPGRRGSRAGGALVPQAVLSRPPANRRARGTIGSHAPNGTRGDRLPAPAPVPRSQRGSEPSPRPPRSRTDAPRLPPVESTPPNRRQHTDTDTVSPRNPWPGVEPRNQVGSAVEASPRWPRAGSLVNDKRPSRLQHGTRS
jgi:MAP/microtubule affinity-regulating kinase